jgi:penicillin-binding protein 1A
MKNGREHLESATTLARASCEVVRRAVILVVSAVRAYFRALTARGVGGRKRLVNLGKGFAFAGVLAVFWVVLYSLVLVPFTPSISDIRKAKQERPTIILSADGTRLGEFKPVHREWVPLDEISQHVVDALLVTEDRRFYSHFGFDLWRTAGAAVQSLSGRRQGGSTITQQLARNLYPEDIGRAANLNRKLKELITSFKIEFAYSKDEILETYLNTVPFLYNAYGIEMAARTYFSKAARDLDPLESATLVGMLKGTFFYNPVRSPERSRERRNVVLAQMARFGQIDAAEYERLVDKPLGLRFERQSEPERAAPHFVEHLREWLIDWADGRGYNIYRDSLVVHTTIDSRMQVHAQRAVDRWMPALQHVAAVEWSSETARVHYQSADSYSRDRRRHAGFDYLWNERRDVVNALVRSTPQYRNAVAAGVSPGTALDSLRADDAFMQALRAIKTRLETGFVAMDPRTGHVLAWIGSREYDTDQFDHVARARRQPGSTFKPFVFAAAIERGLRPMDTFRDEPVEITLAGGEVWRPQNASGRFTNNDMTLTEALVQSNNSVTAQLAEQVGPRQVARVAREMGLRRSDLQEVPSIALGTSSVSLLEMVSGYSTLASGGVHHDPLLVTRIEDRQGRVLYEARPRTRRVLREETADAVVDMLREAVRRGTGRRVTQTFGIREDVAGKTGTTQGNMDGWFVMMSPNVVAGAWVGFNDPRVTFRTDFWGAGGNNAALLVGEFYRRIFADVELGLRGHRFPEAPDLDRPVPLLRRVSTWVRTAASSVAEGAGNAIAAIGGWLGLTPSHDGPDQVDPAPEERSRTRVVAPQGDDAAVEADSLNRLERESRQLDRVIEEIRAQRGESPGPESTDDGPPAEDQADGGRGSGDGGGPGNRPPGE